jgi:hypothetical protein
LDREKTDEVERADTIDGILDASRLKIHMRLKETDTFGRPPLVKRVRQQRWLGDDGFCARIQLALQAVHAVN